MAESAASSKMIAIIVSIVTSGFTINLLYDRSGQKCFWLGAFVVIYVFIQILQAAIHKCCYTREEREDIDKLTIDHLFVIINFTLVFVIVTLLLDITRFFIAITHNKWYDYVNILAFVIGFTLFIFPHTEFRPTERQQCVSSVNRKLL